MDKALREIDARQHGNEPHAGVMQPLAHALPLKGRDHNPWSVLLVVLLVLGLAVAGWGTWQSGWVSALAQGKGVPGFMRDTQATGPTALVAPSLAQLHVAKAPVEAGPMEPLDPRMHSAAWQARGARLWAMGQSQAAAQQWLDDLRRQSPFTLALRIAVAANTSQAESLHQRWSPRMPVVMLKEGTPGLEQWTVLAIPGTDGFEQARNALQGEHGMAVQWGSVAHWLALHATSPESDNLVAVASPDAFGDTQALMEPTPMLQAPPAPRQSLPVQPARPQASQQAAKRQDTPTTAAASLISSDQQNTRPLEGSSFAPAEPIAPPAGPATIDVSDLPDLRRSAAGTSEGNNGPPASERAIRQEFDTVERLLSEGQHASALKSLKELERFIGPNWRTHYLSGIALSALGSWPEAQVELDNAWLKNPGHARIPMYLSVALQEQGSHTQALQVLAKALALHPSLAELWLNRGHSLQALGRSADARAAYAQFMALSATRSDLNLQRAWVESQIVQVAR